MRGEVGGDMMKVDKLATSINMVNYEVSTLSSPIKIP